VLKLDATAQRFKALAVPYTGSFFGVADAGSAGDRLRAARQCVPQRQRRRSVDEGRCGTYRSRRRRHAHVDRRAVAGGRRRACREQHRRRPHISKLALKQAVPLTGIADIGDGKLALVGPRGVAVSDTAAR
jgi:hypothetical protein